MIKNGAKTARGCLSSPTEVAAGFFISLLPFIVSLKERKALNTKQYFLKEIWILYQSSGFMVEKTSAFWTISELNIKQSGFNIFLEKAAFVKIFHGYLSGCFFHSWPSIITFTALLDLFTIGNNWQGAIDKWLRCSWIWCGLARFPNWLGAKITTKKDHGSLIAIIAIWPSFSTQEGRGSWLAADRRAHLTVTAARFLPVTKLPGFDGPAPNKTRTKSNHHPYYL